MEPNSLLAVIEKQRLAVLAIERGLRASLAHRDIEALRSAAGTAANKLGVVVSDLRAAEKLAGGQ